MSDSTESSAGTQDTTYLVPIPPVMPETLAELLAPYLGRACLAVGQGWAMFDDPDQADEFAERVGTTKRATTSDAVADDRPLIRA